MILGAGAELKENPVSEAIAAGGVLRLMVPGLDKGVVDGPAEVCTFTPRKEDAEPEGDKEGAGEARGENGGLDDGAGDRMDVDTGLKTGEDAHAKPVGVTVTVASIKTVSMPLVPVEVKTEMPFGTPDDAEAGGGVGMLPKLKLDAGDIVGVIGEERGTVLEGMIPPKLNVLAADAEPN